MMTRQEIKLKAKEDIRGKVFACFMPFLIQIVVQVIVDFVVGVNTYAVIPILLNIAMYPISVGIASIYLKIVRNKDSDFKISEIFAFYNKSGRLGQILLAYIVSSLFIILGVIFFIIPGIILALRYSMLPFILAEHDDISWREALEKSKAITDGRKGEIFVYGLSFLGWFILVGLTFGILSVYVLPYYKATFANLYDVYNPAVQESQETFQI